MSLMIDQCRLCCTDQKLRLLPCMHELCTDCVVKLYQNSRSIRCPWCRHNWRLPAPAYMPLAKAQHMEEPEGTNDKKQKSKSKSSKSKPSEDSGLQEARQQLRSKFAALYERINSTQTDDVVGGRLIRHLRRVATEAARVYHTGSQAQVQENSEAIQAILNNQKSFPRISATRNGLTTLERMTSRASSQPTRRTQSSESTRADNQERKEQAAVAYTRRQRELRDSKMGWLDSGVYTPSKTDEMPMKLSKYDIMQMLGEFKSVHFNGDCPVTRKWSEMAAAFVSDSNKVQLDPLPDMSHRAAIRDTPQVTWIHVRHALRLWRMVGGGRPLVQDIDGSWEVLKDAAGETRFIKTCLFVQPGDTPRKAWLATHKHIEEAVKAALGCAPDKIELRGNDQVISGSTTVLSLRQEHSSCLNVFTPQFAQTASDT